MPLQPHAILASPLSGRLGADMASTKPEIPNASRRTKQATSAENFVVCSLQCFDAVGWAAGRAETKH